ncbi:DUF1302 domain-containing protein [Hydrocarboniphaga sp.]|uniref:DUF1302 domain-containing protein n=2 Tax=Hydrocarboniphaga TaxID=243627 RepID=UPI00058C14B4|nr:DUF1302 family protein [Hydrocarboniphaga sp.]MDZ4079060.1 DUF1302 family protein [Hydrocarboniphaga sp.]
MMDREYRHAPRVVTAAATLLMGFLQSGIVAAADIETGIEGLKLRWDNTIKYTAAFRLEDPSQKVAASTANPNVDFGDLNFDGGLINNRLDLLSELELSYKRAIGVRVSGAGWYDNVYRRDDFDFPNEAPYSSLPNRQQALTGGANDELASSARDVMGRKAEFFDAFVYGNLDFADGMKLSARAGRFTLVYGETLFLGANGIAAAQGPIDLIKLYSIPNSQFKEIALPVGQVSSNLQINSNLSFGAYYQFDWRGLRLPASGSYFSPADFVGAGADLLLTPTGGAANRIANRSGRDHGQFGGRIKFRIPGSDIDYGLYAAQYDEKSPIPVLNATDADGLYGGGTYYLAYARDITVYGASLSTVIGETNVAGEISTRRNTPLHPLGDLVISFDPTLDNDRNTPYALGNTLHLNLSAISVYPGSFAWDGASVIGEFAWNRLLSVDRNPTNPAYPDGVLNTTHTRNASFVRVLFQPEYFQVLPNIDLQIPIGIGYGIDGRSAVIQISPEHGGDISVGISADYKRVWKAGLQLTHYYGSAGPAPSIKAGETTFASYDQYYADRDFVSLSIRRSF